MFDVAGEARTVVDVLARRAAADPQRRAYTFLLDGEGDAVHLDYGGLWRRAAALAATLRETSRPGERALLLHRPGLDFITAFYGCLAASLVVVPLEPPHPARPGRGLPRLRSVVRSAIPSVVLTADEPGGEARLRSWLPGLAARVIAGEPPGDAEPGTGPAPDELALLQYTSGTTALPRGVMVTHANLMANSAVIARAFAHDAQSRGVIWLPPYHDMGLVGGILQPLYAGFPVVLMSPLHFLQRPLRWLQAVSAWRATTSGGPDFAYDLACRRTTPAQRGALDLRSWRVAFDGAETVRRASLEAFASAFGPAGFDRRAFASCYGLAEATLMVAGGEPQAEEDGLLDCGEPQGQERLAIVDPQTLAEKDEGEEGEVWLRGPSVARGYWGEAEATAHAFAARLPSGEGPFLRTGDLGRLRRGRLTITGRLKDLVIIRGRNVHPQDLEWSAGRSHEALRPGAGAAFSVPTPEGEGLVIAHEVDRNLPVPEAQEVDAAIRRALAEEHDVQATRVLLLRRARLPRTASGKLRRGACRAAYLDGQLEAAERGPGAAEAEP